MQKSKPLYIERAQKFDDDQKREQLQALQQIQRKERVDSTMIKDHMRGVQETRETLLEKAEKERLE